MSGFFVRRVPFEIIHHIIEYVPRDSLPKLRLVSHDFNSSATSMLFRTITIDSTAASLRQVGQLVASETLGLKVQHVIIDAEHGKDEMDIMSENDDTIARFRRAHRYSDWSSMPFAHALMDCQRFRRLKGLSIKFNSTPKISALGLRTRVSAPRKVSGYFRSEMFALLFSMLTYSPFTNPSLDYLEIQCLQSSNETHVTSTVAFRSLLHQLRTLRLSILTTEYGIEGQGDRRISVSSLDFYAEIPAVWLKPAVENLTHLHLAADGYWGHHPRVDLASVTFKSLESLSLVNFTFCENRHLTWLLSHAWTMNTLELDNCAILQFADCQGVTDVDGWYISSIARTMNHYPFAGTQYYDQRWCDYFTAIATTLNLRSFTFRNKQRIVSTAFGIQVNRLAMMHQDERYLVYLADSAKSRPPILGYYPRDAWMKAVNAKGYLQEEDARISERASDERALRGLLEGILKRNIARSRWF